jgi:hypothetical protein
MRTCRLVCSALVAIYLATASIEVRAQNDPRQIGAILTYNNSFVPGGTWLQPIAVLTGRLAKFSAEFTF